MPGLNYTYISVTLSFAERQAAMSLGSNKDEPLMRGWKELEEQGVGRRDWAL
jgi:hypothetical protein